MKRTLPAGIYRFKSSTCGFLNRATKNWTGKKLRFFCFLFVLTGMTLSLFILFQAIEQPKPLTLFPRPSGRIMHMPNNLPDSKPKSSSPLPVQLRKIQDYMDSLCLYDSIKYRILLKSQPLFMDSLRAIENLIVHPIK